MPIESLHSLFKFVQHILHDFHLEPNEQTVTVIIGLCVKQIRDLVQRDDNILGSCKSRDEVNHREVATHAAILFIHDSSLTLNDGAKKVV